MLVHEEKVFTTLWTRESFTSLSDVLSPLKVSLQQEGAYLSEKGKKPPQTTKLIIERNTCFVKRQGVTSRIPLAVVTSFSLLWVLVGATGRRRFHLQMIIPKSHNWEYPR